jgi:hypothetical protein
MKFLMFIKHPDTIRVENVPESLMAAMGTFVETNLKSGRLLDTAGLKPPADGFGVRLEGGRISVTDGPFAETKEALGGYYLIDANDLDHALAIAKLCPAPFGGVEVRPILSVPEE